MLLDEHLNGDTMNLKCMVTKRTVLYVSPRGTPAEYSKFTGEYRNTGAPTLTKIQIARMRYSKVYFVRG